MAKHSTSQNVPKELQARFDEITQLTDAFSKDYLNDEYAQLCREVTATLCRSPQTAPSAVAAAALSAPCAPG